MKRIDALLFWLNDRRNVISVAGLLGVILGLVIFKLPHLHLPYVFDELWVYGPAVRIMADEGISMLPDALPVHYSRGHPLFFHAAGASWLSIFGNTIFSSHVFALFLSMLLLAAIFFISKSLFNAWTALISTILFSLQPFFLAQSSLVLPEVLLSLFILLSIYFYIKRKHLWFVVSASLMLLTKESGVILIGSLGLWALIETLILQKPDYPAFLKKAGILAIPAGITFLFFLLQKIYQGWFLFPDHLGMIDLSWETFKEKYIISYDLVFEKQGKKVTTTLAVGAMILLGLRKRPGIKIMILLSIITAVKIFFGYWKLPFVLEIPVIIILMLIIFRYFMIGVYEEHPEKGSMLSISFLFIFCFLCFSSVNFFSSRYLLCTLPPLFIATGYFIYASRLHLHRYLVVLFALGLIIRSFFFVNVKEGLGDHNLSYVDVAGLQQKVVHYLEEKAYQDRTIHTTFLFNTALTNPLGGYLSNKEGFKKIKAFEKESSGYFLLSNFEPEPGQDEFITAPSVKVIKKFRQEHARAVLVRKLEMQ